MSRAASNSHRHSFEVLDGRCSLSVPVCLLSQTPESSPSPPPSSPPPPAPAPTPTSGARKQPLPARTQSAGGVDGGGGAAHQRLTGPSFSAGVVEHYERQQQQQQQQQQRKSARSPYRRHLHNSVCTARSLTISDSFPPTNVPFCRPFPPTLFAGLSPIAIDMINDQVIHHACMHHFTWSSRNKVP